jgi:kynureninase
LMPIQAKNYILEELDKWNSIGVEGHFNGERPWTTVEDMIIPLTAKVVGAISSEVVNMNSLTVNLQLLMTAFYKPNERRLKIVVEDGLFCSDSHAIRSQLILHGLDPDQALVKIAPRENEACLRTEDIVARIQEHGSSIALVLLSGIQYYTGQLFDIPVITEAGHSVGATVGWDLAHAVGNVQLSLHEWSVDFAFWCSYKYMNAGPGAVGGTFVHQKHHHPDRRLAGLNGLDGWWGQTNESKFRMSELHDPIVGAQGFSLSTAPMLSLMCLLASMEIFQEATMERITTKQRYFNRGACDFLENFRANYSLQIVLINERSKFSSDSVNKMESDRGQVWIEESPLLGHPGYIFEALQIWFIQEYRGVVQL